VSAAPVEPLEIVRAMRQFAIAITGAAEQSAATMARFVAAYRRAEASDTRRTYMHTAYRAKTRRRNRRTK
jgi:hypothetical protein